VTAGNRASKRLLHKSGFSQKGGSRQNYYLNGEWRDDWVFGLLADDYYGQPSRRPLIIAAQV